MTIDTNVFTDKADKALTRTDVMKILQEVGSSNKLILNRRNLSAIDLSDINLSGANLMEANLSDADLSGANLSGANLSRTNLSRTNLSGADLSRADLSRATLSKTNLTTTTLTGANLIGADLSGAILIQAVLNRTILIRADLSGADLSGADLSRVDLSGAKLRETDLRAANLSGANLSGADLRAANLSGADLSGADLSRTKLSAVDLRFAKLSRTKLNNADLSEAYLRLADLKDAILSNTSLSNFNKPVDNKEELFTVHIKILEEPLTAQNFSMIMFTLTNLYTKCWLISQRRFGDLIEYAQTNNVRFAEEANLVIAKLTHNSPADIKFSVDASAQGIAEALKTGIDAITLASHRYKAAELEFQARVQEIKQNELEGHSALKREEQNLQIEASKSEIEKQKALIEIEKQQLEIERQQLGLQKEHLEMQTQRINIALETSSKMVDMLYPEVDASTKAMLLQNLLPNLLQLGTGKGLELIALPIPKNDNEDKSTPKGTVQLIAHLHGSQV